MKNRAGHLEETQRSEAFRLWAQGVTPRTIASLYGLAVEQVQELLRSESERYGSPHQADPEQVWTEQLIRMDALLEELARVAAKESGPTRLRALNARQRVLQYKWGLLQAVGVVPQDLGDWKRRLDGVRMSEKLVEIVERHDLGQEIRNEIVDALMGPERAQELREWYGLLDDPEEDDDA